MLVSTTLYLKVQGGYRVPAVCGGESMLVLTRQIGQSIVIADNIGIMVCAINDHQVYLGIKAPQDVVSDYHEVDRIKCDKQKERP